MLVDFEPIYPGRILDRDLILKEMSEAPYAVFCSFTGSAIWWKSDDYCTAQTAVVVSSSCTECDVHSPAISPKRGTADAEIKDPSVENPELKGSPL